MGTPARGCRSCLEPPKLSRERLPAWIINVINLDNRAGADMARPQRHLDPTAGPVAAFAAQLRELRERAGTPKYTVMAKRSGRSQTALSEAAGGQKLPTWETTEAFVQACGGDPREWRSRWEAARPETNGTTAEDPPPIPEPAVVGSDDHLHLPPEGPPAEGDAPDGSPPIAWSQQHRVALAVASAALLGLIVVTIGGLVWSESRPSKPSLAAVAPAATTTTTESSTGVVRDGADPKDSGCALDPEVMTLESVEVDVAGKSAGLGQLRYSPQCGVAWPRFEQFPQAQIPKGTMLHVDVIRPDDRSLRVPYQAPYDGVPIYGNVMLSTARCVYAAVWFDEPGEKPAETRTHCFKGKTPVRLVISR